MAKETGQNAASSPPEPTAIALVDNKRRTALQFLVREFRLADGKVVGIKSGVGRVRLSHRSGHLAIWDGGEDETVMITADGYQECNRIAQVSVMTPSTVSVPGVGMKPNPFVVIDDTTGCFRACYTRKVAIGPGPLGNWTIVDRTLLYSLTAYLIEDLSAIAKKQPTAVFLGVKGISPAEVLADLVADANADLEMRAQELGRDKKPQTWLLKYKTKQEDVDRAIKKAQRGLWTFFQIEASTGMGYWVDQQAASVLKVMTNYVQGQKFGDRKADSIATRNVLRHHPLMPNMKVASHLLRPVVETLPPGAPEGAKPALLDRYVEVPVYFHSTEGGREELERVFREYDEGIRTGAMAVDADASVSRASREDDDGSERDEEPQRGDPEDELPEAKPKASPGAQPKPDANARLIADLTMTEENAGKALVERVLAKFPTVKANRLKATEDELRAYGRALEAAMNDRDANR